MKDRDPFHDGRDWLAGCSLTFLLFSIIVFSLVILAKCAT